MASGSHSTTPVVLADSFRKTLDCRVKAESAPSDLTRKYWLDMAAQWVRLAEDTDKRYAAPCGWMAALSPVMLRHDP